MNTNINADLLKINTNSSFVGSLLIFALYLIGLFLLIKYVIKKVKKMEDEFFKNESGKTTQNPEDIFLTPIQAGMILENSLKNYHIIATILHFLDLELIDLTKIYRDDGTWAYRFEKRDKLFCNYNNFSGDNFSKENINKANEKKISVSEIYIIDRIVFKYYSHVNADRIYEFYDSIDDYSKLYNLREINELKELDYDLDKVKELVSDELIKKGLKRSRILPFDTFEYVDLFNRKYNEILEYKNELESNTLLPERSIENVYLWGEHLIYGVALNVCKTSIKDAIEIYEGKRKK